MSLLQLFSKETVPSRFVEGRVGYAVGDIHGRADLLRVMLNELEARADADTREAGPPIVVFLGDYVDRGPQSAHVLDLLLQGRPRGFEKRYLKGNHEASMLAFLEQPLANKAWVGHGGSETLMAYGVKPPLSFGADDAMWLEVGEKFKAAVPAEHVTFLNLLDRYVVLGDYAFVHAGVDVSRPLDKQTDGDLMWIRAKFLTARRRFPYRVVHGHTPVERPFQDERRIGVDTGAYASGTLTAVRLEGEEAEFISVNDRGVRR